MDLASVPGPSSATHAATELSRQTGSFAKKTPYFWKDLESRKFLVESAVVKVETKSKPVLVVSAEI